MIKEFSNIKFDELSHTYIIDNKIAGLSATKLIHNYSQEFDENLIAPKSAEKENKTVEQILDEWHFKRDYACEKGNQIHLFAQAIFKNEVYETDYSKINEQFIEQLKIDMEILKQQAISFYEDYKDMLELVKDEQYLYDDDYDVAGSIDLLCKNKLTGEYVIVDFKSNNNFYKKAYSNMKVPLHHLKDDNLSHYSLQLFIYKHIFEKNTNLKVEETFIVYFNLANDNYEIIKPLDMMKEAKQILEMRRVKNMKSLPILLIGKSGSGKSASLRNFTADEVSIVNVLGKELPFRNKLTPVTTDDYERVLNLIKIGKKKTIVIDDAGYLITNQFMRTHSKGGSGNGVFAIYNDIADNFWKLISDIKDIEGNKTVYFLMHEDTNDLGITKPKTIGKMLDEKVCIEGMFTVALRSIVKDDKYLIRTKTDGNDIVKTPIGMFENDEIDNDLKEIDKVIREYYDLDKVIKEEKKEE